MTNEDTVIHSWEWFGRFNCTEEELTWLRLKFDEPTSENFYLMLEDVVMSRMTDRMYYDKDADDFAYHQVKQMIYVADEEERRRWRSMGANV